MKPIVLIGVAIALCAPAVAMADGDPALGAKVFNKCRACHSADREQNRVGPHLVGIIGRPVASLADYAYSEALKARGEEGAVWDEASLGDYVSDPKGFLPGNKMAFAGLKKPEDVENVIAYLKSLPTP